MSKKRRRSNINEADSEENELTAKKHCGFEWTIRRELKTETGLCSKLFDFLRKYKDASVSNSCLSEYLLRAPSRRLQADYYDIIKNPIDVLRIQQKLKNDNYKNVQEFLDDVKLLLYNAKSFYSESSDEYRAAISLEESFLKHLGEFGFSVGHRKSPSPLSTHPSLTLKISKSHLVSPGNPSPSPAQATSSFKEPDSGTLKSTLVSFKPTPSGPARGGSKTTRSKAWISDYLHSDEPQKLYIALVYDYHDSGGELIAGVFHTLPSQKDYPEYYRVISEPIDLNMIKNNVDIGGYMNLKALQDDMILMVKNAQYFNEPGSVLYRKASALRKFVVNKGAELERRYQTIQKTNVPLTVSLKRPEPCSGSSLSPKELEAGKKVPKLSIKKTEEGMMKNRPRQSFSQTTSEVEDSQSESSDDDVFSDEAGGNVSKDGLGQLLLRIKKEKLSAGKRTKQDHLEKLLLAKKRPNSQKCQMAIYRSLVNRTDPASGRFICELFKKRPSVKMYPEYYIVIKQPIDLREIRDNIKAGEYSSLEELMASIELLVNNACTFNEEDSVVFSDAIALKQVARDAYNQIDEAWPTKTESPESVKVAKGKRLSLSGSQISALSSSKSNPGPKAEFVGTSLKGVPSDVLKVYTAVKEHTTSKGRQISKTFEKFPLVAGVAGDYFTLVKKPIDMTIVQTKLSHNLYPTVDSVFEDINLLCDNAYRYYSKDDRLSKDALVLHGVAINKYQEVKAAERAVDPVPDVRECIQYIIRQIVVETLGYKDADGRSPAEGLGNVVVTEEFQHPDLSEDKTVYRSLSLKQIEQWARWGRYSRLDLLQKDILKVLHKAREEFGSHFYNDSVSLENGFICSRDRACKNGSLVWTPALAHTESVLEAELASRVTEHNSHRLTADSLTLSSPSSPSGSSSSDESSSSSSETSSSSLSSPGKLDEAGELGSEGNKEEGVVIDKRDAEYMDEAEFEGTTYQVGNIVYIKTRAGSNDDQQIVLIESLWRDKSDTMWLDGCWFYRPKETFHIATRKFYEKEVFKSDFRSIAKLSRVMGRCGVLILKDYYKFELEGISHVDTYVCESRYLPKTKTFKKIKNWFLPGVQPKHVPRVTPILLKKVPSIFASPSETTPTESLGDPKGVDKEENVDVEGDGEDENNPNNELMEDELELSFSACSKNIETVVTSPDLHCAYYEQFCIDGNHFRLGDFVYLRSDCDLPYIARIHRMWTDSSNDPWIHGPWYIRPTEVEHMPTRVFYQNELFMSNILDINPMRSISGKCSVVLLADFCKKRSTQYSEEDVYITESSYNETEKKIVKLKVLKPFEWSSSTVHDEVYFLPKEIQPLKVPSPKLFDKQHLGAPPNSPPPSVVKDPIPAPSTTPMSCSTTLPAALALQVQLANAVKRQHGQNLISLNPQLMQQLIASASKLAMTSSTRPAIVPGQQFSVQSPTNVQAANSATPLKVTATPALASQPSLQVIPPTKATPSLELASKPSTPGGTSCTCQWVACGQEFQNVLDLGTHLLSSGIHIVKQGSGNYFCKWKNCHRNPTIGGKPFNSVAKLTRHLREVHLLKISNSLFGLSSLPGTSLVPHSPLSQPSSSPSFTSTPIPTQLPVSQSPAAAITSVSTPSGLPASGSIPAVSKVHTLSTTKTMPTSSQTPSTTSSIFLPPPEDRRKLTHSAIYTKYIEGLQAGSKYTTSSKPSTEIRSSAQPPVPPKPIQASDWLGPNILAATKDSASIVNALWALRDHLDKVATKLDTFTSQI